MEDGEKMEVAEKVKAELGDCIDEVDEAIIDEWAFELNI